MNREYISQSLLRKQVSDYKEIEGTTKVNEIL